MAYDKLDPIGEWRGDYRVALLCAFLNNLVCGLFGKRAESTPKDFMLDWDKEYKVKKPQCKKEMVSVVKNLQAIVKGFKK